MKNFEGLLEKACYKDIFENQTIFSKCFKKSKTLIVHKSNYKLKS